MSKSLILPHLALLCVLIFTFYQTLIYTSPVIYWDDAHIRWALRDQLILEKWLPGIQVFVLISSKISTNLYFLKTIMSLVTIGSLIAAYYLARQLFSHLTGLIAFVFLAFNMMFTALGIAPYPDVLFIGLAFMAFHLLDEPRFTRRFYLGIVVLNFSSLTSYAGWFLSMIFVLEIALNSFRAMDRDLAIGQTLKMAALCSIAPLTWLIFGVSSARNLLDRLWSIFEFIAAPARANLSEHILARLNLSYLWEFSNQYFHLLRWQIRVEFLALGIIGFLFAISGKSQRTTHLRILSFLILDWFVLAFLQPWKFGSLRQPFVLQAFLILYAAHGLVEGISRLPQQFLPQTDNATSARWKTLTAILAVALLSVGLIPSTAKFVVGNLQDANILTPFTIASWLNAHLKHDEAILVLDDTDYYPYALATYTDFQLEHILDDRLDIRSIQEELDNAQMVYVIGMYTARDRLSAIESHILNELENGHIQAKKFTFHAANVWYVPASQIIYSP